MAVKKSRVTKLEGPDTGYRKGLLTSNIMLPEDEFLPFYIGGTESANLIAPPYDMKRLAQLSQENNTLGSCVEAMEVNIDGTGFSIEHKSSDKENANEKDIEDIKEFFNEPAPRMSFTTIRRLVRRDLEQTGNGYLEVVRNAIGKVVFLRHVTSSMVRLVRLDNAVPVATTINRGGKDVTVNVLTRERRYAQLTGVQLVYFKEYGSKRALNYVTGEWASPEKPVPLDKQATELIHFTVYKDAQTPYGIPRWISQTPSVMGSRKAEEFNLDFFDAGGIPPVMVFLTGGMLQGETKKTLENMFQKSTQKNIRGAVIEVAPTGGALDSASSSSVKVERFGTERQQDSMFEKYDDKCSVRLRGAFRLPPLFIGRAEDYSFATAFASYVVAEAQVFKPERDEFDSIINVTVMRELNSEYRFRSLPLTVKDIASQLKAVELATTNYTMHGNDIIDALNEIAGLNLKYTEGITPVIEPMGGPGGGTPNEGNTTDGTTGMKEGRKPKIEAKKPPLRGRGTPTEN